MNGWRVTYGQPFPGWRDFPDLTRALEFAETAHAENPTITTSPETLRQLLDSTEGEAQVKIQSTTIRHKVGTCPACKSGLWAECEVLAEVGTPYMSSDGEAHVTVTPRFLGMEIHHHCLRNEDGDWTYLTEEQA